MMGMRPGDEVWGVASLQKLKKGRESHISYARALREQQNILSGLLCLLLKNI